MQAIFFVLDFEPFIPTLKALTFCYCTGNCSPRFMRSTMYSIPCNKDVLQASSIPLATVITPFAETGPSEVSMIRFSIISRVYVHCIHEWQFSFIFDNLQSLPTPGKRRKPWYPQTKIFELGTLNPTELMNTSPLSIKLFISPHFHQWHRSSTPYITHANPQSFYSLTKGYCSKNQPRYLYMVEIWPLSTCLITELE